MPVQADMASVHSFGSGRMTPLCLAVFVRVLTGQTLSRSSQPVSAALQDRR